MVLEIAGNWKVNFGSELMAIAYVIGFYCVVFVLHNVVKTRSQLIVDRKLSVRNLALAVRDGLKVPAAVTIVGFVAAIILTAVQEPERGEFDWEPMSLSTVFAQLVITVQLLLILAGAGYLLYRLGRVLNRHVARPVGRSARCLYQSLRPKIPIRW